MSQDIEQIDEVVNALTLESPKEEEYDEVMDELHRRVRSMLTWIGQTKVKARVRISKPQSKHSTSVQFHDTELYFRFNPDRPFLVSIDANTHYDIVGTSYDETSGFIMLVRDHGGVIRVFMINPLHVEFLARNWFREVGLAMHSKLESLQDPEVFKQPGRGSDCAQEVVRRLQDVFGFGIRKVPENVDP